MKKLLSIEEKQGILMSVLCEAMFNKPAGYAIFGIEKEVVKPLIKKGWIHADTFKYTGGATLTKVGEEMLKSKMIEKIID